MQWTFDLSVSSSSSKGPNAIAESQNFCIIVLAASFGTPPLFPTYFSNKKAQERKEERKKSAPVENIAQFTHNQLWQNFEQQLLYMFHAD